MTGRLFRRSCDFCVVNIVSFSIALELRLQSHAFAIALARGFERALLALREGRKGHGCARDRVGGEALSGTGVNGATDVGRVKADRNGFQDLEIRVETLFAWPADDQTKSVTLKRLLCLNRLVSRIG